MLWRTDQPRSFEQQCLCINFDLARNLIIGLIVIRQCDRRHANRELILPHQAGDRKSVV